MGPPANLSPETYARIMERACRGQSVEEARRRLTALLARRDALLRGEGLDRTAPPRPIDDLLAACRSRG